MSNQIRNIAFSGGGIKALAYSGVLKAMEDRKLQHQIRRVAGASGGSMIAALFAVGYHADEIKTIMETTDFEKFKDGGWSVFGAIYRFCNYFGIYEGDYAENWIEGLLKERSEISNITFLQVFEKFGIDLIITGTSLSKKLTYYYNYFSHPEMKVAHAVRISISYPIVFKPVKEVSGPTTELLVDGGMLNNYPINYFFPPTPVGDEDSEKENPGNIDEIDYETIGFLLLGGGLKPGHRIYYGNTEIKNVVEYCEDLIDTLCLQIERQHIKDKYWQRTVAINTENVSAMDFNLTDEQKKMLYDHGYQATIKFLNRIDPIQA